MFARITGTGSYLPEEILTNDDLVGRGINTSDHWISERTGIRRRHIAAEPQMASDLAFEASKRAIQSAQIDINKIDLIIVATSTPDYIFPSTACLLQAKLAKTQSAAAAQCTAFDIQAVCSGFIYALATAEKFIRSGSHQCALVVGSELFSRILDWNDRSTCVLFGDGAGAVILEASDTPGILATALHADGRQAGLLSVPGGVSKGHVVGSPFLQMDGQAVFKFAVKALADIAEEVLLQANLPREAVDWFIPHQANQRILQATAKKIGFPFEKVISTVDCHANTSAASVPLALDTAVQDGRVKRGHTLLLEGVGGGFTWGAILLTF